MIQLLVKQKCILGEGNVKPGDVLWVHEARARHLLENDICTYINGAKKVGQSEKPEAGPAEAPEASAGETPQAGPSETPQAGPSEVKKNRLGMLMDSRSTALLSSSAPGFVRPLRV